MILSGNVVYVVYCLDRDHFLKEPGQPDWLVRFPMVKASLRAMDAITEFIAKSHPELEAQLDYYSVAGASKRGWTTWDVGAVDSGRVMAIVPIVLDAINFVEVVFLLPLSLTACRVCTSLDVFCTGIMASNSLLPIAVQQY